METTSSPQSKKKRGAPLGNTNALKHGRYSRKLQAARLKKLSELLEKFEGDPLMFLRLQTLGDSLRDSSLIPLEAILSPHSDRKKSTADH